MRMKMKGMCREWACLLLMVAMVACSKEEDPKPEAITAADFEGEWSISSFKLAGEDQTSTLDGFTFEIFSNGDFLVNKDGKNDSYGSYDVDEATNVLTVDLTNPKEPGKVINGTWQAYDKTDQKLTLKSYQQGEKKEFVLTRL